MGKCQNCKRLEEQNKAMYEALKRANATIGKCSALLGNLQDNSTLEVINAILTKIEGKEYNNG